MKNKLTRLIFILAIIFMSSMIGFGCSIGMDGLDDILDKNDLSVQITYYSNGGWFNNDTNSVSRDIYYKANTKALELTTETPTKIYHEEDIYSGWYTIESLNIDGTDYFVCDISSEETEKFKIDGQVVVVNKNDKLVIKISDYNKLAKILVDGKVSVPKLSLDTQFDFSAHTLVKGEKIYLATNWIPNQKIEFVLFTEDCSFITVINDDGSTSTFNNGDVVATKLFDKNGNFVVPTDYNLSPVDSEDATFVDFYVYDEQATLDNLVRLRDTTANIARPTDGSNVKVFVKYVAGDWEIVRFADDFKSVFSSPAKNYYISRDIDCSELKVLNTVGDGLFKGKIRGNGYTVSGVKTQATRLGSGAKVALFGRMSADAEITDITFKNISLTLTTRAIENNFINVFLLAHTLTGENNPKIENVEFDGVTIDITLATGVGIENFTGGYDAWLCVGKTNSEFKAQFTTFEIKNYQIIVNNEAVATDK